MTTPDALGLYHDRVHRDDGRVRAAVVARVKPGLCVLVRRGQLRRRIEAATAGWQQPTPEQAEANVRRACLSVSWGG